MDLRNNQIIDLTPLSEFTGLQSLYLGDNQIIDLTPLSKFTGLQSLGLSSNKITDLTPLSKFTGLQSLGLSSNKITDLTPLSKFTGLQELNLGDNQITDPTPVYSLRDLEYLVLRHNQLNDNDQIQRLLECFPKLKGLSLSQNSLPIESALLDDLAGLRAYFKDAIKGTTQKRNAKLLFLGDGCVGKTTLLEHLKTLNHLISIQMNEQRVFS